MILENVLMKIAYPFAALLLLFWLIEPEFHPANEELREILSMCIPLVYENLKLLLHNVRLSRFLTKKIGDIQILNLLTISLMQLDFRLWSVPWWLSLDFMNCGCGDEDSKHSQIFVVGLVTGCKIAVLSKDYKSYPMLTIKSLMFTTLILAFSDLQRFTVKDVMVLLAARRLINPIQIERYSLEYRG